MTILTRPAICTITLAAMLSSFSSLALSPEGNRLAQRLSRLERTHCEIYHPVSSDYCTWEDQSCRVKKMSSEEIASYHARLDEMDRLEETISAKRREVLAETKC